MLVFPRHLRHALISLRYSEQIVSGPGCREPLRYSACFFRPFSPKALIHVSHFCHRFVPRIVAMITLFTARIPTIML
jgi:hypothetical protein